MTPEVLINYDRDLAENKMLEAPSNHSTEAFQTQAFHDSEVETTELFQLSCFKSSAWSQAGLANYGSCQGLQTPHCEDEGKEKAK